MNSTQQATSLLIDDTLLAKKILASKFFCIPPVQEYLRNIDSKSEYDFSFLINFSERILLFMKGKKLWEAKKLLAQVLNREELSDYTINLQPYIHQMLESASKQSEIDLANDFTNQLYKRVVEELWGVRVSSVNTLIKMANGVAGLLEPMSRIRRLIEYQKDCEAFYNELMPQLSTLNEKHCLVKKLRVVFADLNDRDFCFLLMSLIGGMRSAFDALNNSFLAFLELKPEKRKALCELHIFNENIDFLATLFSPSNVVVRKCSETVLVGEQTFIEGQHVLINMRTTGFTLAQMIENNTTCPRHSAPKSKSSINFGAGPHRCPGRDLSQFLFPEIFNAAVEPLKYSILTSSGVIFEDNEMTKRIVSMPVQVIQAN